MDFPEKGEKERNKIQKLFLKINSFKIAGGIY
jgi:hypothetical protein